MGVYRKDGHADADDRRGRTEWMMENAGDRPLDELLGRVSRETTVGDILWPRLGQLGMSVEVMAQLAGISRGGGYKIVNNSVRPGKDVLLRIAFVLGFRPEQAQQLLKSGKCSLLTGSSKRDVAVIYGLENGLSLGEMDEVLEKHGLPTLVPPPK